MTVDVRQALQHSFTQRKLRANELLDRHPHTEQILTFYINLLEIQEPLSHSAPVARWANRRMEEGPTRRLRLDLLPTEDLLPLFSTFLQDVTEFGTGRINLMAERLEHADSAIAVSLLQRFSAAETLDDLARELQVDPRQISFFPRAFLQPIAEALAARVPSSGTTRQTRTCPICGKLPQVALVRDEAEIKGRRFLVCSLCGTPWPYPRSTCAGCGEARNEKVVYHASDTLVHLRVEECLTCRAYIKSVDLRKDGRAIPLVDELASVVLDVWAEERGLRKIEKNLLLL